MTKCPFCGSKGTITEGKAEQDYTFKGIVYTVDAYFYLCSHCGESFTDDGLDNKTLAQVGDPKHIKQCPNNINKAIIKGIIDTYYNRNLNKL